MGPAAMDTRPRPGVGVLAMLTGETQQKSGNLDKLKSLWTCVVPRKPHKPGYIEATTTIKQMAMSIWYSHCQSDAHRGLVLGGLGLFTKAEE